MAYFNEFPNTRNYDSDLGWLIKAVKQLSTDIEDINSITYHDPIGWNITTQYERNTVVKDPVSGILYISKQPVPTGISLTNTDYWIEIGNMSYEIEYIQEALCPVDEGDALTATQTFNKGDFLWWSDKLYRAKTSINIGDAFGTNNIREVHVSDILKDHEGSIDTINTRVTELSPITLYKGTTIHIFGDSNTVPSYINEPDRWYATVAKALGANYSNHGQSNTCWQDDVPNGGGGYRGDFRAQIAAQPQDDDCKLVMIMGGINDFHYGTYSPTNFSDAIWETVKAAHTKYPNALIVSMMDCGSQDPCANLLHYARAIMIRGTASTSTLGICALAIPTSDLFVEPSYWYNTNHYSQQGNNKIARRILTSLFGNGQNMGSGTAYRHKDFTTDNPTTTGYYNCGWECITKVDPILCIREDEVTIYFNPYFANNDTSITTVPAGSVIMDDIPALDCTHGSDSMTREYYAAFSVRSTGGTVYFHYLPLDYIGLNYDQVTESPKMNVRIQYATPISDLNGRTRVKLHFTSH